MPDRLVQDKLEMPGGDLKDQLHGLALSRGELAALLGVAPSTVWRWLNGQTPVPRYVQVILLQRRAIRHMSSKLLVLGKL